MIFCANDIVEHYGKRIEILHGCPFEGWPNRAWPFKPFLPKWVGWPCPVRSALKRTPVQDFNSFSILFYYIISTTYQKIGDLFCLVIFLDFRTVCKVSFFGQCTKMQLITLQNFNIQICFSQSLWFFSLKFWFIGQIMSRIHLILPKMHTNLCVLIDISMEIGMFNFWSVKIS